MVFAFGFFLLIESFKNRIVESCEVSDWAILELRLEKSTSPTPEIVVIGELNCLSDSAFLACKLGFAEVGDKERIILSVLWGRIRVELYQESV